MKNFKSLKGKIEDPQLGLQISLVYASLGDMQVKLAYFRLYIELGKIINDIKAEIRNVNL